MKLKLKYHGFQTDGVLLGPEWIFNLKSQKTTKIRTYCIILGEFWRYIESIDGKRRKMLKFNKNDINLKFVVYF